MLISKTTITNEPMSAKKYELTLKIPLTYFDGDLDPRLSQKIQNVLRDWRDGRYSFYVEMLHEGLWKCLTTAASQCIIEDCQTEFGREMVPNEYNGETARWYIESSKRQPELPHIHDEITVEIK